MKPFRLSHGVALAALLLAAGCGAPTSDEAANAGELVDEANEILADENGAEAAAVEIAPLPAAPRGVSAADAAPLDDAGEIASEIASDTAVERVPFEGGWAWRRNGQTLRTATRDGRRVSYFRPGETTPFFVQQGDQAYAYQRGRVQRAYDRRGRPAPVSQARREDADRLAEQSRRDRDQAQRAPRRTVRPGTGGGARPPRDREGRDNRMGGADDRPDPTRNTAGEDRRDDRRLDRRDDESSANRMAPDR